MVRFEIDTTKVAWREVDGELVLINLENTYYYSLNQTGSFIWKLLIVKPHSADELAHALADHYQIADDVASQDVSQLIQMLTTEELIKEVTAP